MGGTDPRTFFIKLIEIITASWWSSLFAFTNVSTKDRMFMEYACIKVNLPIKILICFFPKNLEKRLDIVRPMVWYSERNQAKYHGKTLLTLAWNKPTRTQPRQDLECACAAHGNFRCHQEPWEQVFCQEGNNCELDHEEGKGIKIIISKVS